MEYRYEFTEERAPRRMGWKKLVICIIGVILILVGIFLGGYFRGIEEGKRSVEEHMTLKSELTHVPWHDHSCIYETKCPENFPERPLILISLDGFRSDYLARKLTPAIQWLADCGVQGPMQPVFPSKTFPNHYTIVTGLYPESHGIVDNKIYDPVRKQKFSIGNAESLKPIWWQGEPLWVTSENEGKKSAIYFWPGSDVKIKGVRPTYFRTYNGKITWDCRIETVLSWLDLPMDSRPSLITVYLNEPDSTGHNYGPYSKQINDTLEKVDIFIGNLLSGLDKRKLLGCANIIIVADHGMEDTSCKKLLFYDKYINISDAEFLLYGVTARIRPLIHTEDSVRETIKKMKCKDEHFRIYDKRQLPKRFHYSYNDRIDPIVIDLDPQWLIFKTPNNESGKDFCDGGAHGYDNIESSMRALFIGHGPAFKSHFTARPFPNIELYNIMADLLNITAKPNNGTKGSLHYLLKTPGSIEEEPTLFIPNECSIATVDFEELKEKTGCGCNEVLQLDNYEDNVHIPWGMILTVSEEENKYLCILYNEDYTSAFHSRLRLPTWAAYTLKERIRYRKRPACWFPDSRIPLSYTSTCTDYLAMTNYFVQEPLFPSEFSSSVRTIPLTWLVTNSVPMFSMYNSNINDYIHEMILQWTKKYKTINVITGGAFDIKGNGIKHPLDEILKFQKYNLSLPTHYFFIITRCLSDVSIEFCLPQNVDAMAFLLPHLPEMENCQPQERYLLKHSARVKDVEILTGLRFFTRFPVYERIRLQTQLASQLWDT